MRVAFGLKAHSGWSALVVVGVNDGEIQVIDSRRIELVDSTDAASVNQPYHAAESLDAEAARDLVGRGVAAARRAAVKEMRSGHRAVTFVAASGGGLCGARARADACLERQRNPRSAFPHAQSRGRTLSRRAGPSGADMRTECCHPPGKTTGGARGKGARGHAQSREEEDRDAEENCRRALGQGSKERDAGCGDRVTGPRRLNALARHAGESTPVSALAQDLA